MSRAQYAGFVSKLVVLGLAAGGIVGCQQDEGTGSGQTAFPRPGAIYPSFGSPTPKGASCSGVKSSPIATRSGTYEERVRAELEAFLEAKPGKVDSEIRCSSGNGRAQTYFVCSAYERFQTHDNYITVEKLSDSLDQIPTTIEAAKDALEVIARRMQQTFRDGRYTISELPYSRYNAAQSRRGYPVAVLSYQVPGCKNR